MEFHDSTGKAARAHRPPANSIRRTFSSLGRGCLRTVDPALAELRSTPHPLQVVPPHLWREAKLARFESGGDQAWMMARSLCCLTVWASHVSRSELVLSPCSAFGGHDGCLRNMMFHARTRAEFSKSGHSRQCKYRRNGVWCPND